MADPQATIPSTAERPFDLVLFGATGFTGRLLAQHLATSDLPLRWALCGRSADKLRAVRQALTDRNPACAELPILTADASDPQALAEVAQKTRVICTTVGPYLRYGLPVVAACAAHGTDYCDLTGEVPFMRASIDGHSAQAQQTGARILHACGFDSIPSDLGVLALHDYLRARGQTLREAHMLVKAMKGKASGGTLASMLNLMEQAVADRSLRRLLANPYALVPDSTASPRSQPDLRRVTYDREAREWTAPFLMSTVNTRVVHRTNALLGYPYGRDFRYSECMGFGDSLRGATRATMLFAGLAGFAALSSSATTRQLLSRYLPKPGEGPSPEAMQHGYWRVQLRGFVDGDSRARALLKLRGEGDPGYGSTSRMLFEVARMLVETHGPKRAGGVHTPGSALGMPLVSRLARAGLHFEFSDLS